MMLSHADFQFQSRKILCGRAIKLASTCARELPGGTARESRDSGRVGTETASKS
jgi:hypothetical protein